MAHPRVNVTDGGNPQNILAVNSDGTIGIEPVPNPTNNPLSEAIINFTNGGDNTIVAGIANQVIRVYRYFLVVASAVNITAKDGTNALTGAIPLQANEAMVFTFDTKPWFTCSAGNAFIWNTNTGVQVSGRLYYTQS